MMSLALDHEQQSDLSVRDSETMSSSSNEQSTDRSSMRSSIRSSNNVGSMNDLPNETVKSTEALSVGLPTLAGLMNTAADRKAVANLSSSTGCLTEHLLNSIAAPKDLNRPKLNSSDDQPELNPTKSIESFDELPIAPEMMNGLKQLNIEKPNELQSVLLPELIGKKYKDVFVRSRPHSGKKIAYLINAIQRVDTTLNRVQCVILTPSYELVVSTAETAKEIGEFKNLKVDYATENELIENCQGHIIVTSLHLLHQCLSSKKIGKIDCLILDELDLTLSRDKNIGRLREVVGLLKDKVGQYQFFSNCSGNYALNVIRNHISPDPAVIDQLKMNCLNNYFHFYWEIKNPKHNSLLTLLKNVILDKVLVFAKNSEIEFVCRSLKAVGFKNILSLDLNSTIQERLIAINNFNTIKKAILVLVYPLTHGIALDKLSIVINYDLPPSYSYLNVEYFHRIARCTNHDEKPNFIVNLVDERSKANIAKLENFLGTKMIHLIGNRERRER